MRFIWPTPFQTQKDIQGRLRVGSKERLTFFGQVQLNPVHSSHQVINVRANFSHQLEVSRPHFFYYLLLSLLFTIANCLNMSLHWWYGDCCHQSNKLCKLDLWHCTAVVLNRRPLGRIQPAGLLFVAPELLFFHYVFWLGQHVYTRTCLHANDTQTAWSLSAVSADFNFHFCFWSSLHFAACRMACSKFTAKRKVDSENRQFKKNGLKNLHSLSLQPAQDPCA